MTETTFAYLVGFVDGDGHISIHRRRHGSKLYFSPLIGMGGTAPNPLLFARSRRI